MLHLVISIYFTNMSHISWWVVEYTDSSLSLLVKVTYLKFFSKRLNYLVLNCQNTLQVKRKTGLSVGNTYNDEVWYNEP